MEKLNKNKYLFEETDSNMIFKKLDYLKFLIKNHICFQNDPAKVDFLLNYLKNIDNFNFFDIGARYGFATLWLNFLYPDKK